MQVDAEVYCRSVRVAASGVSVCLPAIGISSETPRRAVLFAQGFGIEPRRWVHQTRYLPDQARVTAAELPGHGHPRRGKVLRRLLFEREVSKQETTSD